MEGDAEECERVDGDPEDEDGEMISSLEETREDRATGVGKVDGGFWEGDGGDGK